MTLNILGAYPYCKRANSAMVDYVSTHDDIRFLVDSGAFTAWKSGNPIKLDDYCTFLDDLPIKPWKYFALDVIGDPDRTMENYQTMLNRGLNPIPVFTRGEDISVLDEYYKTSDVVGIGGLVRTEGNRGFVKGIMNHVGDRKVHWLGFNYIPFLLKYRPFMCDSSSWAFAMKYGQIPVYLGGGKFKKILKKDMMAKPNQETIDLFEHYGEDVLKLKYKAEWVHTSRNETVLERVAFKSFVLFQYDVYKKLGTQYFLSCESKSSIQFSWDSYMFWKNKGVIK